MSNFNSFREDELALNEQFLNKEMRNFTGMPIIENKKEFWDDLDIDTNSKYLNLIEKIKEFKKEIEDYKIAIPFGNLYTPTGLLYKFENHFKEELSEE